jgi:hypothetical protein
MNIDHLRVQLDEIERRAEETHDAIERQRIVAECTLLERSIAVVEDDLQREIAALEALRKRLRRVRARG